MKRFNIAVIGCGMYVSGRGTKEQGTIMPAILEWSRKNSIGTVYIAGTNPAGIKLAKAKIESLFRKTGVGLNVTYLPEKGGVDKDVYKKVFKQIEKPAMAIISVPDHLHGKIAAESIKNGIHTLVVKPLAPTVSEVRSLLDLQDKRRVYCAVEFHKRYDYANIMLKDVLCSGRIGSPLYFIAEFSQRKNIPLKTFKKWVSKTNIFQYLGIHYVDVIYFATGAVPLRAMATGEKGWLAGQGIDTYDAIQATVEWKMKDGAKFSSSFFTNWIDPESSSAMSDQKIKVIGTKGRFESDQKKRGITILSDDCGIEEPNPYFCKAYGKGEIKEYRGYGIESIKQFLDDAAFLEKGKTSLAELEKKRATFKNSLVPTMVLEAINRSLKKNGEWIKIKNR